MLFRLQQQIKNLLHELGLGPGFVLVSPFTLIIIEKTRI